MRYCCLILFSLIFFDAIATPEVCLYENANYQGVNECLGAQDSVTWSEQDYLNNKVSSIIIPEGLRATIYHDESNGPSFTLLEDMNINQLDSLKMQDSISRITVTETPPLPCDMALLTKLTLK